jgi:hypothetical protein
MIVNIWSSSDFRLQGLTIQQDEAGNHLVDVRTLPTCEPWRKIPFKGWIRWRIQADMLYEGRDFGAFLRESTGGRSTTDCGPMTGLVRIFVYEA